MPERQWKPANPSLLLLHYCIRAHNNSSSKATVLFSTPSIHAVLVFVLQDQERGGGKLWRSRDTTTLVILVHCPSDHPSNNDAVVGLVCSSMAGLLADWLGLMQNCSRCVSLQIFKLTCATQNENGDVSTKRSVFDPSCWCDTILSLTWFYFEWWSSSSSSSSLGVEGHSCCENAVGSVTFCTGSIH